MASFDHQNPPKHVSNPEAFVFDKQGKFAAKPPLPSNLPAMLYRYVESPEADEPLGNRLIVGWNPVGRKHEPIHNEVLTVHTEADRAAALEQGYTPDAQLSKPADPEPKAKKAKKGDEA